MKVIVDRSRWLRGEGGECSSLQRDCDGKRCCLGFACLAAGATEDQIAGFGDPGDADVMHMGPWKIGHDHVDGNYAVRYAVLINDACVGIPPLGTAPQRDLYEPIVDDADREARLIRIFASQGVELEFVDGPLGTP